MNITKRAALYAVVCVLALAAFAGCSSSPGVSATDSQQSNRSYMSQVNETMDQLSVELESFVDAVSRGDVVNMRTQADNAYQLLDKLSALEVPDDLKDVKDSYENGAAKLREALDSYIGLYTEAQGDSFDWSTYDKRLLSIQSLYDEGVEAMKKGDETAADKQ